MIRVASGLRMVFAAFALAAFAFFLIGPLVNLALWSVAGPWPFPEKLPRSLSFDAWMRLLPTLAGPLRDDERGRIGAGGERD